MNIYELDNMKNTKDKPYWVCTDEERNAVNEEAIQQFIECMKQPSVIKGFLDPDFHAGYVAPIGSVILTKDTIFPSFVGYDIGCGMSESLLDINIASISREDFEKIKNEILQVIPIGFAKQSKQQSVPKKLLEMPMTAEAKDILTNLGLYQIGTLGGGNHFLEIGKSDKGLLSIIVHSGSRGVGHKIATYHMKVAAIENIDEKRYEKEFDSNPKNIKWFESIFKRDKKQIKAELERYTKVKNNFVYRRVHNRVGNIEDAYPLDIHSTRGVSYINDMNVALVFALENRKLMIQRTTSAIKKVLNLDSIKQLRFINKNHNHAELTPNGWVHRKGATQADKGMLGVIPGNMVDGSFIVVGKGNPNSLNSSSHGAGRVLSRRKAKENLSLGDFKHKTAHLVANHSDSNLDESPDAYKNIFDVMNQQKDLVQVLDRIVPILNIKG